MDGYKEILSTWISESELASFYVSICADLRNRGVEELSSHATIISRGFAKR